MRNNLLSSSIKLLLRLMLEESKHEKQLTTSKFRQRPIDTDNQHPNQMDQDFGMQEAPKVMSVHNYSQFSRPMMGVRPAQPHQAIDSQPVIFAPKREEDSPKISDTNKQETVQ